MRTRLTIGVEITDQEALRRYARERRQALLGRQGDSRDGFGHDRARSS